jgi:hypothetical protein
MIPPYLLQTRYIREMSGHRANRFLLSWLTQSAKKEAAIYSYRPHPVLDQSGTAGQILVNLQEQATQHNPFLNGQPLGKSLFYVRPDDTHGALANVALLC